MGKAEELLRQMGGAILESASHRSAPAAMPTTPAGSTLAGERMKDVSRSRSALEIPIARIGRDDDQPREEFEPEALARLAESIRSKGLLQPISVRWVEGRGRYVIVSGERRWRAATIAGLATISCVVIDRALEPGELLALQCIENLVREDLRPIEKARAFRTLLTVNNWSGNQLAGELGISQSAVAQALALLELPESVQASVESGELSASTAYAIAQLDDGRSQGDVAARVMAEGLSRAETAEVVREVAAGRTAGPGKAKSKGRGGKPRKPTERVIRTGSGIRITLECRKGLDPGPVLAALREAVALIQAESGDDRAMS